MLTRKYLKRFFAKPRRIALSYAALAMVVMLLGWRLADQWIEERLRAEARVQVTAEVTSYGISLTQTLTRRLNLVSGLSAFASIEAADGIIPYKDFEAFAESIYLSTNGLRNIALAPQGIMAYVYPFEENKTVLGYEPATDERPNVREEVQRAITTKEVVMSLPSELIQGGIGVIARQAIFVEGNYWGLANIVIDVPPLFSEAGFSSDGNSLQLAIKDQNGQVFFGLEDVFDEIPVSTSIILPEGNWELVGLPKNGWRSTYEKELWLSRVLLGFIIMFWTWSIYLSTNRHTRLKQNVEEKTENLRNMLQDMHATEDRFQAILHSQIDLILRFSPEGRITFVNEAYCQFFGKKPDDFYGMDYLENSPKEIRLILRKKIAKLSQETPIIINENENLDAYGKVHWFSWSNQAIFNAAGLIVEYQSIGRDITEEKKAGEALRKSQTLYSQAELMGKMGHWEWDHKNYKLTSCSPQFAKIYEMTMGEAMVFFSSYESEISIVHPDDLARYEKALRDSEEERKGVDIEYKMVNPSGNVRHLHQRSELVFDEKGEIIGSFGTVQDITERVQAEQAAQQQALEISVLFSTGQLLAEAPPDSTEIAQIIARQLVDVLGLPEASIALYDPQGEQQLLRYIVDYFDPEDVPPGVENWTGILLPMSDFPATIRAMETLEPQIMQISDPEIDIPQVAFMKEAGTKTEALFPMAVKNRFIGIIGFETWVEEHHYSLWELNLTIAMANLAAVTLERAQLYETAQREILERKKAELATRQQAMEFSTLFSVSQMLAQAPPDLYEIALIMARQFVDVIGLPEASITLYNSQDASLLYLVDYFDPNDVEPGDEIWEGRLIPISDNPDAIRVMETLEPLIIQASDPNIGPATLEYFKESGVKTEALFPMTVKGRFIGIIELETWFEEYHYTPGEIKLSMAMANQTALALESAQLYETAQREILERKQAEEELQKLNLELESRVKLRTAELDQRLVTVEKLNTGMANMMDDLNMANQIARKKTRELLDVNVELESFTYSVSHDLRAPLRHIESFSRLLNDNLGDTLEPTSLRYLNNIITSTARMRNLIEDLLTLSRTSRADLRIKPLDFNAIIESVRAQLFDEVEGRQITWKIATLPPAHADSGLMKIFWENLIRNAVKYTSPREEAIIEIGSMPSEGLITFYIKDNGIGFAPEYHEQLFGVFQRLQKGDEFEGSGVGLATAKRIIERHGGKIWADGEPDKGAIFYFNLPQEPIF